MSVHLKAVWSRAATAAEDEAVCTFDLMGEDELTQTVVNQIGALFNTWWFNLRAHYPTQLTFREVRFYDDYDGDGSPGEVDFVHENGQAGLNETGMLPPQCACSMTEEVYGFRRHWGRVYLPGPAKDRTGVDGRYTSAFVQSIVNEGETLYEALDALGRRPGVYVSLGVAPPNLVSINGLRCDDIVDIIRRRRWETFVTREIRDLGST